ncbi:alpha/beta hydrolase [Hufsiella ginkgonis]|uniref:Alpha/beta fold hydrolase n=1 Tax=Hufsiella ginkgonis TaxID=2695274 RepID=A0A7K1Y006_9SPHI|nr:alpha/beta hydrolase [Hufsiella ginkgonis]MXV16601.1 hypothetical protein [Hufsiella ginkgonis]
MRSVNIKVILLLFSTALLFCCKGGKSKNPRKITADDKYLYQDIARDTLFPATIEEITYTSGGARIYGFGYLANGEGPHATIILVHANPGNERNLDLAQNLRRAGVNVFYFDYRGSWGSEGTYTYANCIEDTRSVVGFVTNPDNALRLRVDIGNIFLVGHNLGAGIGMIEGLNDPRVRGVAAVSLVNPYTTFRGENAELNFSDMNEYFETLGMLKMDSKTFLLDIVAKLPEYNIEKMVSDATKPVLVIDEQHNNEFLKKYTSKKNVEYEFWDTDLEFSDKRIALTRRLKEWLDKNKGMGKRVKKP